MEIATRLRTAIYADTLLKHLLYMHQENVRTAVLIRERVSTCTLRGKCATVLTMYSHITSHSTSLRSSIDMGVPQYLSDQHTKLIKKAVEDAHEHMVKEKIRSCRNMHRECAWFAARGHCTSNPALMEKECAPVCHTCVVFGENDDDEDDDDDEEELPAKTLAELNPGVKPLTKSDSLPKASTIGLSRSRLKEQSNACMWKESDNKWKRPGFIHETMQANKYAPWYHSTMFTDEVAQPPFIIMLEQFITMHEAKYLIVTADEIGWTPSQDANRTYSTAICKAACREDIIIKSILMRMELTTGFPPENIEDFEFRRYQSGQEKKLGHDYQEYERSQPQGVRVASFYISLTPEGYNGDESAAMHVPRPPLDLTIPAKIGRAVFWANVQNSDPNVKEPTMEYRFKPADNSVQYGLMFYLHQRNYQDTRDCPVKKVAQS